MPRESGVNIEGEQDVFTRLMRTPAWMKPARRIHSSGDAFALSSLRRTMASWPAGICCWKPPDEDDHDFADGGPESAWLWSVPSPG